jgi:hypothetical protein
MDFHPTALLSAAVLPALLLASCASAPRPTDPPEPAKTLEALQAKTDALVGFTARYRATFTDGEGTLTLRYAAPGWGSVSVVSSEGEGHGAVSNGHFTLGYDSPPACRGFGTLEMLPVFEEPRRITRVLESEFPSLAPATGPTAEPGVDFVWNWSRPRGVGMPYDPLGQGPFGIGMEIAVSYEEQRTHLCGWLEELKRRPESPSESPDSWTWNLGGHIEVEVSRITGFVTRQRVVVPDGSTIELVLEELEFTAPPAEVFVELQTPPEGTEWITDEMTEGMRATMLHNARAAIWGRLARRLADGRLVWDADSPEKLKRVFRALKESQIRSWTHDRLPVLRWWIEDLSAELGARTRRLRANDQRGRAALEAARVQALALLDEWLDDGIRSILASTPPTSVAADFARTAEFLACERSAALVEYERQMRAPLLAYFHERFDAALTRQ